MWRIPLADVRTRDVLFMVGCHHGPWSGPWVQRPLWEPEHAPGSPSAGEELRRRAPWKASPLPNLVSCRVFQIIFLVNIFLRLKEDALTGGIVSKTGTSQSVNPFTFTEDTLPRLVGPRRAHPWHTEPSLQRPSYYMSLQLCVTFAVPLSPLLMQNSTKCTSVIWMVTLYGVTGSVPLRKPGWTQVHCKHEGFTFIY